MAAGEDEAAHPGGSSGGEQGLGAALVDAPDLVGHRRWPDAVEHDAGSGVEDHVDIGAGSGHRLRIADVGDHGVGPRLFDDGRGHVEGPHLTAQGHQGLDEEASQEAAGTCHQHPGPQLRTEALEHGRGLVGLLCGHGGGAGHSTKGMSALRAGG